MREFFLAKDKMYIKDASGTAQGSLATVNRADGVH